jgi:hypothetical protein
VTGPAGDGRRVDIRQIPTGRRNRKYLEQIRLRAFEGAVITAMLDAHPLKPELAKAFNAILEAIDHLPAEPVEGGD